MVVSSSQIDLAWGAGPTFDPTPISSSQEIDGTWALFDVVPDGKTQLNIILVPTSGAAGSGFTGIMFDGGGIMVPEPSVAMLFGIGAALLWLWRRLQR